MAIVGAFSTGIATATAAEAEAGEPTQNLEALVRKADFDAAEKEAQRLLVSGTLTRPQVARIHLELGIVASAKRDSLKAEAAFRRALRLDHDLRLSAWVGPHVTETFDQAKAALLPMKSAQPTVSLVPTLGTGDLLVEVTSGNDEDDLARRLLLRIGDLRDVRDFGAEPLRFVLSLPPSVTGCATARASILDEHGNELWPEVASARVCRLPAPSPSTSVRPTGTPPSSLAVQSQAAPSSPPIRRSAWISGAVTGALAVGTSVLGFVALERRNEYQDSLDRSAPPDEQLRLRNLASTAEYRATFGTVLTALAAAATVVFYFRGRF